MSAFKKFIDNLVGPRPTQGSHKSYGLRALIAYYFRIKGRNRRQKIDVSDICLFKMKFVGFQQLIGRVLEAFYENWSEADPASTISDETDFAVRLLTKSGIIDFSREEDGHSASNLKTSGGLWPTFNGTGPPLEVKPVKGSVADLLLTAPEQVRSKIVPTVVMPTLVSCGVVPYLLAWLIRFGLDFVICGDHYHFAGREFTVMVCVMLGSGLKKGGIDIDSLEIIFGKTSMAFFLGVFHKIRDLPVDERIWSNDAVEYWEEAKLHFPEDLLF